MSFVDDLLIILSSYSGGYALMRRRLAGRSIDGKRRKRTINENTLRITLSRLKKRGLVENKSHHWCITKQGRNYVDQQRLKHSYLHSRREKNMIIAFDIPESLRRKRNWLRSELIVLGFVPLQKSVWFGPSPLPQKFITSVDELKLMSFVKFFKAVEADIV